MKTYLVGKNAQAYHLFGKGVKNRKFVPTEGVFMNAGRTFEGVLVFIPMTIGFQPVIKVLDPRLTRKVYYSVKDVKPVGEASNFNNISPKDYTSTSDTVGLQYYDYANPNTAPELVTYQNDYPQYSNADGEWWKNLMGNKATPEQKEAANNREELTVGEMSAAHEESGSKMSFGDWLKSDQATGLANNMSSLAIAILNKDKGGSGSSSPSSTTPSPMDTPYSTPSKESKILGMHPLTLGITVVGLLVGTAVVITLLKSRDK